jgi:hypothetical protein
VQEAEKIAALAQAQPNTGLGRAGEPTQGAIAPNTAQNVEPAAQDEQASVEPPASGGRRSSESKKGRHAIRHRTAARRENGSLRAVDHWLRRHLPLAID